MKNYFKIFFLFMLLCMPVHAFEDCIISTNGKLTDIKIQHNDVIDVFPLITIMNDKNTLIVHPLKEGSTKFSVVKNEKEKYIFVVKVNDEGTFIEPVEGFDILSVDCPPNTYGYSFDLDEPPGVNTNEKNTSTAEGRTDNYIKYLDEPPVLRGAE